MSEYPKTPPPKKSSWPEVMRALGPYMNIGWMFVVSVGLGILGGRWADTRFGTEPWLFLLGALLGIAVGFYNFFLVVLRK
jgi:F0F1-type ATP synthase assembly protein I